MHLLELLDFLEGVAWLLDLAIELFGKPGRHRRGPR